MPLLRAAGKGAERTGEWEAVTFFRREDAKDEYELMLFDQLYAKKRERNSTTQPTARIAIQNEIYELGAKLTHYRRTGEKL